jgi:hypothetical protein
MLQRPSRGVHKSASRRVASRACDPLSTRARAEIRTNFWLVTTQPDLVAEIDFVTRDVETRAASRRPATPGGPRGR